MLALLINVIILNVIYYNILELDDHSILQYFSVIEYQLRSLLIINR